MKLASIEASHHRDDRLHLLWYLSKRCNYDCSYCSDALHDGRSALRSLDEANVAINHILQADFKRVRVGFSGGEPLLHRHFTDILKNLKSRHDKKVSTYLVSNASFPAARYIELLPLLDGLALSFHSQFQDANSFLSKAVLIQRNASYPIDLHLMVLPGQLESNRFLDLELRKAGARPHFRRVRAKNSREPMSYSDEEVTWLQSQTYFEEAGGIQAKWLDSDGRALLSETSANEIVTKDLNRFRGWSCSAGVNHYTIWNDGFLYRCEGGIHLKEQMGSIYDPKFSWPRKSPYICPLDRCVCTTDVKIPKVAPL